MTLSELFETIGYTDKHTTHGYDKFYGPFLDSRKGLIKNFLEIGVAEFGGVPCGVLPIYARCTSSWRRC